jgi:hypothetical protein
MKKDRRTIIQELENAKQYSKEVFLPRFFKESKENNFCIRGNKFQLFFEYKNETYILEFHILESSYTTMLNRNRSPILVIEERFLENLLIELNKIMRKYCLNKIYAK